ncbi:MAG: ATP-dependent Zn protease [Synechococcales bacterium]|nr:ATP-dependent Zn protease [Synechococcales bacterium]
MNSITFNLVAIAIFSITMTSLIGPIVGISPVVPALITVGLMGAITVDTLSFQGRGGTLLIDGLAQFAPEHRERVIRHEAGHFLVAYLMNIPVTDYTLTAWEALRRNQPGRGGVTFDTQELEQQVARGELPAQLVDRYGAVWMAGIAAEQLTYGNSQGGNDDRQKFRILWQQLQRPQAECEVKLRWSALKARTLLEAHHSTYEALVEAMTQRRPVADCIELMQRSLPSSPTV